MSAAEIDDRPLIHSILHPTDFSEASEAAFAHALSLALLRQTELTLLHVKEGKEGGWSHFPAVRGTLEKWGLLKEGSPADAVFDNLGILVKKVALKGRSPLKATLAWIDNEPTDIIVLASRGREGLPRWLQPSVAESLARKSRTMTLFVPSNVRGIVEPDTGKLSLRRILLPVVREPSAAGAVLFATRVARLAGTGAVDITLLYPADDRPDLELPEDPAWRYSEQADSGDPSRAADDIVEAAERNDVDLIAMATAGHQGVLDALRGSTTEQVVRRAPCPVLAIPSV